MKILYLGPKCLLQKVTVGNSYTEKVGFEVTLPTHRNSTKEEQLLERGEDAQMWHRCLPCHWRLSNQLHYSSQFTELRERAQLATKEPKWEKRLVQSCGVAINCKSKGILDLINE